MRALMLTLVLAGCGDTCVTPLLRYQGKATGRAFVKMWRVESALTPAQALVVFPSIDDALRWQGPTSLGSNATCWHIANAETWTLQAWIDVSGVDTDATCARWEACVPHGGDPSGEITLTAGSGSTTFDLTITDSQ
jgi:hypothetical protein